MEESTIEAVQARHRKEQKDLQGRITSKKKNATKKTRKAINDECAQLERALKERQEQELAAFSGETAIADGSGRPPKPTPEIQQEQQQQQSDHANGVAAQLNSTSISDSAPSPSSSSTAQQQHQQQEAEPKKKRNRQKERLARRAAEQEAAALAAEEEAKHMTDHRGLERTNLQKQFKALGLVEKEIAPDGHCLFSAVADQLGVLGMSVDDAAPAQGAVEEEEGRKEPGYKTVRRRATSYMAAHADDFAPFCAEEDFEGYVRKMRDTAEWGGQLELMALARTYGVQIRVVQDGRTETIEPGELEEGGETKGTAWLAYYRHGFGLGEHYNSLRRAG